MAKVQDEAGHGRTSTAPPRRSAYRARRWSTSSSAGKAKYSWIFNYPTLSWADIGAIGWLVDGAAIMNQIPICRCSYGPYARAMVRICKEESFHQRQGYEIMMRSCARHGTAERHGTGRAQPLVVAVADDVRSVGQGLEHSEQAMRWKIKRFTNDELRQKFVDTTVPQAEFLGLKVPDPALAWDEATRHSDIGPIDWDEF